MRLDMTMQIVGVKPSNFTIDDYSEDTTKVFALVDLNSDDGGFGQAVESFNYAKSDDIHKFKDLKFPFSAKCQVELVTSGKKSKLILHDIELPKQDKPQSNIK